MLFSLSVIVVTFVNFSITSGTYIVRPMSVQKRCEESIYRRCNHPTHFTHEELENARMFIQHKFMTEASYKPLRPPCARLRVKKDFKCMTHKERLVLTDALKRLYRNGVMEEFSEAHVKWWPSFHKLSSQFAPWHRWFGNELEKRLRQINPDLSLPYWQISSDFAKPEKSLIWDYFGHSGNYSNGYCVTDGMFKDLNLRRCVKRQWNEDNTLNPWGTPEMDTALLQNARNLTTGALWLSGQHFLPHLSAGGFRGDLSIDSAPYDFTFYLWHSYYSDVIALKMQLGDPFLLTPTDYDSTYKIDDRTGRPTLGHLATDRLSYFGRPVLEAFQVGFGDLCWIPDQLIKPINRIIRKQRPIIPLALTRMPPSVVRRFYPRIASGSLSPLGHSLPDVGACNRICKPTPMFKGFNETEAGIRQWRRFKYEMNIDTSPLYDISERQYKQFITSLNELRYCSPYVA